MSMQAHYRKATDEQIRQLQEGGLDSYEFMFENENLDIGQAWHVLHYAITGDAGNTITEGADESEPVISMAVLGGLPVNEEDLGYGPLLYCPSDKVREVAEELKNLPKSVMEERLTSGEILETGAYLAAEYAESEEGREDVYSAFEDVKKLFISAAENGENVVFGMG